MSGVLVTKSREARKFSMARSRRRFETNISASVLFK